MKKILRSKKGFTLMEVIVVLIIIAVLAAALIPSFIGFINQSRAATDISAARVGMTAAQVEVTHMVAAGLTPNSADIISKARFREAVAADTTGYPNFSLITFDTANQHVTGLTYVGTRYTVVISQTGTDYAANTTPPVTPP